MSVFSTFKINTVYLALGKTIAHVSTLLSFPIFLFYIIYNSTILQSTILQLHNSTIYNSTTSQFYNLQFYNSTIRQVYDSNGILRNEYMTGFSSYDPVKSELTLALLEDSGIY